MSPIPDPRPGVSDPTLAALILSAVIIRLQNALRQLCLSPFTSLEGFCQTSGSLNPSTNGSATSSTSSNPSLAPNPDSLTIMKPLGYELTRCIPIMLSLLAGTCQSRAEVPAEVLEKANNGDVEAMNDAGIHYLLDKRYDESFAWTQKAADKGNAAAQAGLGFMYYNGSGCKKDLAKTRDLYEKSAKGGAHQGLNNLAHLYRYGLAGLPKDQPKAEQLLIQAAELGNEYAVITLSKIYSDGEFGPPDFKKSLHWLKFGTEKKYPGCFSSLGYFYQHGMGVEVDLEKAIDYYKTAIDLGSAAGASNLGYLYLMGQGVAKDYKQALELFTRAADQGYAGGMINLAVMKHSGLGCERDDKAVRELLTQAAATADPMAATAAKILKSMDQPAASPPDSQLLK